MNWFAMLNKASNYIEEHITDHIDLKQIAKECYVSYPHFVKIFSMMSGYTLKEYIRNRRITLASYEVCNSDQRIIDIALKYGYATNEAFSRAFKKIHGINPSAARKTNVTLYTHFPILQYEIPKRNLISLRYDIITNQTYDFTGETTHVLEKDYEETNTFLDVFYKSFKESHPSDKQCFRVHYYLSDDTLEYDYLVGYQSNDVSKKEHDINLHLEVKKAVRFIAPNIGLDMVYDTKKIIYNEWQKNHFKEDGLCEIEYMVPNKGNTFDFYYIVSIY